MNRIITLEVVALMLFIISCSGSSTDTSRSVQNSSILSITGDFNAQKQGMAIYSTTTATLPGTAGQFYVWEIEIIGEEAVDGGDEVFTLSIMSVFLNEFLEKPETGSYEIGGDFLGNELTFYSVYEAAVFNSQFEIISEFRYTTLCESFSDATGVLNITETGTNSVTGNFTVDAFYVNMDTSECSHDKKISVSGEFTATKSEF